MKKIISLLLIITLLMPAALISCSETPDEPDNSETSSGHNSSDSVTETETESETEPEIKVENLDGFTLRMLNYSSDWFSWANTLITSDELTGETLNDALYNRTMTVEQNFNAAVSEEKVTNPVDILSQTVLAGDDTYDMCMVFGASLLSVFTSGYLSSWNNLSTVNFNDEWWDKDAAGLYNFGGKQIAMSGDYSLYDYSTRHCYVFNKNMFEDLNTGENLYQLVNDGRWTLDKLYEIAALAVTDLNGDGEYTNEDRYGISGSVTRHYSALIAGAGIKYVDKNESGELYFTIPGNENAVTKMQHMVSLNVGNNIFYNGVSDIGGNTPSLFKEKHTLFTAAYINEVSELRDMEDEIGILPPPKYNEEQKEYYSLIEGGAVSIIPRTLSAERYENVGTLLNALAYYSRKDVIPTYIDVILKSKVSRDEESAAMLDLIFNTSVNDLGTGVWSANIKNQYTANIFLPKSEDIASLTARIQKIVDKDIEKFTKAVSEMSY